MNPIYPKDFECKLGFDKIRNILSEYCTSSGGKKLVDKISFSYDFDFILTQLRQTLEMKTIVSTSNEYPKPNLYDIHKSLISLKASGSFITAEELLKVATMIEAMRIVHDFYCQSKDDDDDKIGGIDHNAEYKYPYLSEIFINIKNFPAIYNEINRCINRYGEIVDNASAELFEIRKSINSVNVSINRVIHRALEKAIKEGLVEKGTTPSVRDGRMVIPVSAGSKYQISGIIHDESATGKTVFIEPAEVVEVSNRLKELRMEEHRAEIAVLIALADTIRPEVDDILASANLLSIMDFIKAKALFALDVNGEMPILEKNAEIDWFHAIHPILLLSLRQQGRNVVPLNISLNSKQRFLIVSGPNAGGKSVVLKTVGVVQYMTQCGLLPTLNYNSHVGIFSSIFIDIGDEQSIENDLSTYSSHLKNMKHFLLNSSKTTLLLADEMGSGTEPQIGGALAQSILTSLAETGCMGIITTHYQNLKTFADSQDGFVNGAMLYDRGKLKPTFQLAIGNPGSSFALEIARNIGLPISVIKHAKEIVGSDYVNMDKYLLDIERDRRYWANKRQQIKEKETKLNNLLERYEDTSDKLKSQRASILREAQNEAKEILSTANAKIEATIKEIRDVQAEKERTKEIRKKLQDFKKDVESKTPTGDHKLLKKQPHRSRKPKSKQEPSQSVEKSTFSIGDYVKMSNGGVTGKILSIQGKKAEVAFGALRTFVELSKLIHSIKPKETGSSTNYSISTTTVEDSRKRQLNFKPEIDVRGMRADEALQAVTYFLDDAIQFSIPRVRILHGTGHGILKTLIREQLRVNPAVSKYGDEDVRFGGAGITVVNFD